MSEESAAGKTESETTLLEVSGANAYGIRVGRGMRFEAGELLGPDVRRVLIVHQPTLAAAAAELRESLTDRYEVLLAEIPDAEAAKRVEVAAFCWQIMGQADFTRSDAVIGFGGGAATDLAGFVVRHAAQIEQTFRHRAMPGFLQKETDMLLQERLDAAPCAASPGWRARKHWTAVADRVTSAHLFPSDPSMRRFLLPFALFQLGTYRLARRFGPMALLAAGTAGYALGFAALGRSGPGFLSLILVLLGAFAAVIFPPTLSLTAEWTAPEARASALAGFNVAGSLGFALGPVAGAWADIGFADPSSQSKWFKYESASAAQLTASPIAGITFGNCDETDNFQSDFDVTTDTAAHSHVGDCADYTPNF